MLAIAGGKGGAGKTTTTACLARALADDGSDPVAVDGDCDMPDLHLVAGTPGTPGLDAYADGASLDSATHAAVELPGVRVLPAVDGDAAALSDAVSRLSTVRRPVLVDTPAGASPVVATALQAADAVVLVTTPTRESLEDAAKTAEMARTLGTPVVGSVVTASDGSVDPDTLLDCPTHCHVPAVESPLTDARVADGYERLLDRMNERNI